MAENRISNAVDGKREYMVKPNTLNMAYPSQHVDMEIPYGSRDHVIVPDTLKITFNLEIESTDKTRSVVNNVGRVLIKKRSSYLLQKGLTRLTTLIFMKHTSTFTKRTLTFIKQKKNAKKGCLKAYSQPMA